MTKKMHVKILGKPATSVLKWMGQQGWSYTDAYRVVVRLASAELSPATIQTGMADGKNAKYAFGTALLTGEEINTLNAARNTPPATETLEAVKMATAGLLEQIAALQSKLAAGSGTTAMTTGTTIAKIRVERYDGSKDTLKATTLPAVFHRVLKLAEARRNIMLVGPAGCGKSYLAKLIAKTLGLSFGSVSCSGGMSESHFVGRCVPNIRTGEDVWRGTAYTSCYGDGGVFLADEWDAVDANVAICVNGSLANGRLAVPRVEAPEITRHEDFLMIATANTFGRGATRVYAGRNQLDEATLDRFRIGTVECDYDPAVELHVCPADSIRQPLQALRQRIDAAGLRRVLSTRYLEDAYIMHRHAGWGAKEIIDTFQAGWSADERAKVK